MSDEECPVTKRIKFDSDVDESNLQHFDVIDEVQGDGSGSECGMFSEICNESKFLTIIHNLQILTTTLVIRI